MSVINKVLRDLDKRQGAAAATPVDAAGVRIGTAEIYRAAISIQNSWNFQSGATRYDRWDYETELEAAIDAEVFHASHTYRRYS